MRKEKIIFILGIWTAILPYLGFPNTLKNILFSLTGLIFIYIAYTLYKLSKIGETEKQTFDNFSENNSFKIKRNSNSINQNEENNTIDIK